MLIKRKLIAAVVLFVCAITPSQSQSPNPLLQMSERSRAAWIDSMLTFRLDSLLPEMMRKAGIDMWIMTSREYNEDPVMKTMLPAEWLSARRRTMMVFFDPGVGKPFQKVAIARYDVGRLLKGEWNIDVHPNQWEALSELVQRCKPARIGVNRSTHFGLVDGLVNTEKELLEAALPPEYRSRLVSAEALAISWLETRSAMELAIYPEICSISRQIIMDCFDEKWIKAGETTTDDIVWRLRQRVKDQGLDTWFHPSVSIQRADSGKFDHLRSFSGRPRDQVVQYGDLLHVDFGIVFNRLHTDQQQHFYVMRPGEEQVPSGLRRAFETANNLQDILTRQFRNGVSGNDMLLSTLEAARKEGMVASVYSHPIGFHGHAAGPTIGMWDQQNGVKGAGDYAVFPNTAYSIELNAANEIPEWGKVVRIMLEEDGYFDGRKFQYFDGRQTAIYTLRLNE